MLSLILVRTTRIVVASTVINAGSLRLDSLDVGSQYDIYKIIINQESDIALIQVTLFLRIFLNCFYLSYSFMKTKIFCFVDLDYNRV